jgi:hypothetical protein
MASAKANAARTMLLRWMEYDPIALTVLIVGMGAVSLLALSI